MPNKSWKRPKGSLTAEELENELVKDGRVRTYWPSGSRKWYYLSKKNGKYSIEHEDGSIADADFNGIAYSLRRGHIWVFTNYWFYYSFMLKHNLPLD